MNLGERIRNLRKENNLSQEELAEKLNISRQSISKWELNVSTPDMENLIYLSRIFEISLDDLIGNETGQGEKILDLKLLLYFLLPIVINIVGTLVAISGLGKNQLQINFGILFSLSSILWIYLLYRNNIFKLGLNYLMVNIKYNLYLGIFLPIYLLSLGARMKIAFKLYDYLEKRGMEKLRLEYKLKSIYTVKSLNREILEPVYARANLGVGIFRIISLVILMFVIYFILNRLLNRIFKKLEEREA